ncbi:MAG: maleylpyruvate isomerase [Deltaproteobacteria bacterium HGW-Deltaproteobacteria-4]|nr:MAG: maleylpyruvate isomerase [Deltaproteobacteria bacterium HGW-Deltaproteobacteria-4]
MTNSQGMELAAMIRQRAASLLEAFRTVDEELAARAPGDRWSPRMIVSHLSGPEGKGHTAFLRLFIAKETPLLELNAGNPFYSEKRAAMDYSELLAACEANYEEMAGLVAGLTDTELARTAHIPELKETPFGEYPSLTDMIRIFGEFHIQSHIDHLHEILGELAASG